MSHRFPAFIIAVLALAPAPLVSQTAKKPPAKTWVAPRTPDGHPDLQGVWTNPTITPFERPAELAAKSVLTKRKRPNRRRRPLPTAWIVLPPPAMLATTIRSGSTQGLRSCPPDRPHS